MVMIALSGGNLLSSCIGLSCIYELRQKNLVGKMLPNDVLFKLSRVYFIIIIAIIFPKNPILLEVHDFFMLSHYHFIKRVVTFCINVYYFYKNKEV